MKFLTLTLIIAFILMPLSALSSNCCCEDEHSSNDCSTCLVHICKCTSFKLGLGNFYSIYNYDNLVLYPQFNSIDKISLFSPASLERPPKIIL